MKPAQIDGTEDKPISFKAATLCAEFHWRELSADFVLPNFCFHVTTAYDILHHNGVPVGKLDYLGPLPAQPA